ncbi:MAG: transposase [Bryobacteraceae bacterium]
MPLRCATGPLRGWTLSARGRIPPPAASRARRALAGSALFTDALKSYEGLDEFQHEVVDHAVEYVRGEVHANGLENFWCLVKRGIEWHLHFG